MNRPPLTHRDRPPLTHRDRAFLDKHRALGKADERPARGSAETIDVAVELRRESEKAWLVFDGVREVWVPKSQCKLVHERGDAYALHLPEWLAKEKGII